MNYSTFVVALLLAVICVFIIRSMIKNKKSGRSSCCGDCSQCGSQCPSAHK